MSDPILPPVICQKIKGYTYVRTYKNVRVDGKKYPVKVNVVTIAEINNAAGSGRLIFKKDFLATHPELEGKVVLREYDSDLGKYVFKFASVAEQKEKETQAFVAKVNSVKSVGFYYVCNNLLENDPLVKALKATFKDSYNKLLSLGMFCANDNGNGFVADHYSYYAQRNKLPYSEPLSCSQITKLFKNISEASVLNFFCEYAKQLYENNSLNKNRFWALDSTSISTYSRYLDAKFGHNKQGEDLPQVNVMMMTDEKSGRPLFYEMFNGSIPDVSTIAKTFKMLLQLDVRSFVAVMDRGYYSKDNLGSIINCGYHFLVCTPHNKVKEYDSIIKEAQLSFVKGEGFNAKTKQFSFTKKHSITVKNPKTNRDNTHQIYVHVFFSASYSGKEMEILACRRDAVTKLIKEGKELDGANLDFFNKYLEKDENGNITYNTNAYVEAGQTAGLFVLLSDSINDADVAYRAYKEREAVEVCFKDLKVKMGCDRFDVSSEDSLVGKCFVEFIALSIRMLLLNIILKCKRKGYKYPTDSLEKIIHELDGISQVEYTNGFVSLMDVSKTQHQILRMFHCTIPDDYYSNNLAYANRLDKAEKPHGDN